MRSHGLIVGGLLLLLTVFQPVFAGEQDFQLYNRTGVDIYSVFISPTGVDEWEEDVMEADMLLHGADIEINFDSDEEAEFWDIRVEDREGNALVWKKINLLEAYEVILEPDGVARIKK